MLSTSFRGTGPLAGLGLGLTRFSKCGKANVVGRGWSTVIPDCHQRREATYKTGLDRFVTSDIDLHPKNNSLLAYAVSEALKNLIPARLEDDYEVDRRAPILGEGRFGIIRPCTHKITGVQAAVKTQYKMQCKRNPVTGEIYELEAMRALVPGAYVFFNSYETALKLHIVTERLVGPNVFNYLDEKGWRQPRNEREELEKGRMVARLLRATIMSHKSGLAHLDVKFENFMFRKAADAESGVDPVLIDYGSARPLKGNRRLPDIVGSPSYAAPEVVVKGRFADTSDSWSIGVMAFTILQGHFPFDKLESRISDYNAYFCPLEWRRISAEAQDFVRKMLKVDPEERLSLAEALEHPWVVKAEQAAGQFSAPKVPRVSIQTQRDNTGGENQYAS